MDTLLDCFGAKVFAPLPGANIGIDRAGERIDSKCPIAANHDGPQIALFVLVGSDELPASFDDLGGREWYLHSVDVCRIEEPVDVRVQSENGGTALRVVATNAFEDRRSVVDHVRHHVDGGLLPR